MNRTFTISPKHKDVSMVPASKLKYINSVLENLHVLEEKDKLFEQGNKKAEEQEKNGIFASITWGERLPDNKVLGLAEGQITSLRSILGGKTLEIIVRGPTSYRHFIEAVKEEIKKSHPNRALLGFFIYPLF